MRLTQKKGQKMETKKHNGWTNYATWRIALEMFDGYTVKDLNPNVEKATREDCKEYVETYIEDTTRCYHSRSGKEGRNGEGLDHISAWANAFLADVNWQEIADHLNDEVTESECYGKDAMHIDEIIDSLCLLT